MAVSRIAEVSRGYSGLEQTQMVFGVAAPSNAAQFPYRRRAVEGGPGN
jgi:hypothetical protein